MRLNLPVGDETVPIKITESTDSIRVSLRTAEPSIAKDRQAGLAAYLNSVFAALREKRPVPLTHRQAVALSGELYRAWARDIDASRSITITSDHDGSFEVSYGADRAVLQAGYARLAERLDEMSDAEDGKALGSMFGPIATRLLLDKGIDKVDAASRQMLFEELGKALKQSMEFQSRKMGGDYSHDPKSERFPEWKADRQQEAPNGVSLMGLVDAWWREAGPAGLSVSTHESYRKAFTTFVEFLEHDDASRVTSDDMLRFKDHLLTTPNAKGKLLAAKTIKTSYLAGLRSVFAWAVANRRLKANPAIDIPLKVAKRAKTRETWFRPDEIAAILKASSASTGKGKEPRQRCAGRRWVPWLCAYSGARVGEMMQLRKQDIRKEGDAWVLTITPDAGRVKDKEAREVPLHTHLVEQGFMDFVNAAPDGHLFLWSGTGREAWRTAKNRLTEFIRTVVTDPGVQPNHGWRHTFRALGSEAGIQEKVLDSITGHEPRTVGEGYGGVTLVTKVKAMKAYPRLAAE